MRAQTAASIKSSKTKYKQEKPKENTRVRNLYDRFVTGETVYYKDFCGSNISYLRDQYNMTFFRPAPGYWKLVTM